MLTNIFANLARNSKCIINNNFVIKNYTTKFPLITNTLVSSTQKKYFCEKKEDERKPESKDRKEPKKEQAEKTKNKPEEKKEKANASEEKPAENKKPVENKKPAETAENAKAEDKKPTDEKKPAAADKKKAESKEAAKPAPTAEASKSAVFDNKKYISLVEKLNKESYKVMEEKERIFQANIEKQLLPSQRKFVDKVARYFSTMNLTQINYSLEKIKIDKVKLKLNTPIQLNNELPTRESLGDPSNPNVKEFSAQKDLMIALSKWFIQQNPGFGLASGPAAGPVKADDKAEKKEAKEQKKEKEIYDLELTAFDAAKKIALIKEVRTLTSLGLKEAKELVEKAPTILMKGVKKAEAEELVKKMKDAGATITLK